MIAKYGDRPHDPAAFSEKLAEWRESGVPIKYGYGGQAEFHGSTVRERVAEHRKELDAAGVPYEPAGSRWV